MAKYQRGAMLRRLLNLFIISKFVTFPEITYPSESLRPFIISHYLIPLKNFDVSNQRPNPPLLVITHSNLPLNIMLTNTHPHTNVSF
jgi:hypothetical protein